MFTACGTIHPQCLRPVAWMRSSVELNVINNKPLLLHLVGCPHYLYFENVYIFYNLIGMKMTTRGSNMLP